MNERQMETKKIIIRVFVWGWIAYIVYQFFNAIFTNEWISWKWGYYNEDMIGVMLLCLVTMLAMYWFDIKDFRERIEKLECSYKTQKEKR